MKFSLTEGDIGWIPYFPWRCEHVNSRHSGWTKYEFPPGYVDVVTHVGHEASQRDLDAWARMTSFARRPSA
jgi:hypothetical protein